MLDEFKKLSDKQLLAILLYGEARGEPVEGQIAVANVVRNRVRKPSWWGSNWQEVILKATKVKDKWYAEFSCFNEDDPNCQKLLSIVRDPTNLPKIMRQLSWIAEGIIGDLIEDNTHGACYYMTNSLYNSDRKPKWATKMKITCVKGNDTFLKEG
jgi:hypothetical protein